jgi:GTP-binding protein EngB required for normal cell division
MDLIQYERTKFELAAILRSAEARLRSVRSNTQSPFTELFARLAEDRFNLIVIGRFSRGKSSLMNALLDTERLPMGIVPITSVITTVSYGSRERAFVEYQGSHLDIELPLDKLPDYITQQGNPGNRRAVTVARVELPSELLRRGFHFVDTPGLGSAITANNLTTERFLPQADAFMLVTSFDSPLSEEELNVLRRIAPSASRVFLVVNKHDLASPAERREALAHVHDQARRAFGEPVPRMFCVSAREALEANRNRDQERYAASGVEQLRAEVTRFLLADRQTHFLLRMCERVADALKEAPYSKEDADRLRNIQQSVGQGRPDVTWTHALAHSRQLFGKGFRSCEVCRQLDDGLYDFLCQYQWRLASEHSAQADLAARGGLCSFHYWHLESVASPQGICIGLSALVERWARRLQDAAAAAQRASDPGQWQGMRPTQETCDLCRVHLRIERTGVARMAQRLEGASSTLHALAAELCLPHLEQVIQCVSPDTVARRLLLAEAAALQRLSEDMRRYALQRDGLRRELASEEDASADHRALMLLGGHRNVFGLRHRA